MFFRKTVLFHRNDGKCIRKGDRKLFQVMPNVTYKTHGITLKATPFGAKLVQDFSWWMVPLCLVLTVLKVKDCSILNNYFKHRRLLNGKPFFSRTAQIRLGSQLDFLYPNGDHIQLQYLGGTV